jgi:hypothetical protein
MTNWSVLAIALALILCGCEDAAERGAQPNTSAAEVDESLACQVAEYDTELDKMREQASQYDKLLDKWEAQAQRLDRILDQWETFPPKAHEP